MTAAAPSRILHTQRRTLGALGSHLALLGFNRRQSSIPGPETGAGSLTGCIGACPRLSWTGGSSPAVHWVHSRPADAPARCRCRRRCLGRRRREWWLVETAPHSLHPGSILIPWQAPRPGEPPLVEQHLQAAAAARQCGSQRLPGRRQWPRQTARRPRAAGWRPAGEHAHCAWARSADRTKPFLTAADACLCRLQARGALRLAAGPTPAAEAAARQTRRAAAGSHLPALL